MGDGLEFGAAPGGSFTSRCRVGLTDTQSVPTATYTKLNFDDVDYDVDGEKALLTDMVSIQEWLNCAVYNKIRKVVDRIVKRITDKQPEKMSMEEKLEIIRNTKIESAAEKNARYEAEMGI